MGSLGIGGKGPFTCFTCLHHEGRREERTITIGAEQGKVASAETKEPWWHLNLCGKGRPKRTRNQELRKPSNIPERANGGNARESSECRKPKHTKTRVPNMLRDKRIHESNSQIRNKDHTFTEHQLI